VNLVCEPLAEFVSSWRNPPNATEFILFTEDTVMSSAYSIPLGFTEPYFELLGREVRLTGAKFQAAWTRLALGSETTSRVFAICFGYVVVSLLFCLYLNILTVGNARTAGLAVRNAVRQQLLVLKVRASKSLLCSVFIFRRLLPSFSSSW
jgi:E3 ubiquitin-protein ligase MARCH6